MECLGDYRFRQFLYGLVEFWMHQETRVLNVSRENSIPYWDICGAGCERIRIFFNSKSGKLGL